MQVSTSTFFRRQTDTMSDLKTESAQLQQKIATGKKLALPSDEPVAFSEVSVLKSRLARLDQYTRTVDSIRQRISDEESTLAQVGNVIIRMQELVIQGSNDTNNADDRKAIGREFTGLMENLIALANTKDFEGGAVFGGYLVEDEAFTRKSDGTVVYNGDTARSERMINDDTQMEVTSSGSEVFMSIRMANGDIKSLFEIVKGAADSLEAGERPVGASGGLKNALDHITGYQAISGARLSRLDTQTEILDDLTLAAKSRLSGLEDIDIEEAITELKKVLMNIDAAQASFVKIADLTLFNYLK
jgi:flagellar hook-associated protein 3 FlgL